MSRYCSSSSNLLPLSWSRDVPLPVSRRFLGYLSSQMVTFKFYLSDCSNAWDANLESELIQFRGRQQ